ncbi:MAG: D-alanyl-D-alanine dipeptidase [Candidatus Aureabacteria bacterium]|nr:D-alanyl-D-alanine dipeptidase [Candidatus Auribacterota bacterium]
MLTACSHKAGFVDLQSFDSRIVCDIRYATENNITGKKLYDSPRCFLLRSTAEKLKRVQDELEKKGLGIKVYDAYRPPHVQDVLWAYLPDADYMAPPEEGSSHSRGAAVDVTLVTKEGKELDMGTAFDDLREESRSDNYALPYEVLSNRILLKTVMKKHGFIPSKTEWWHFYDKDWKSLPVVDLPVKQIKK